MSISVKSIDLSIGGTSSNKFKMEIDGALYHFDNFKLEQKLLHPCKLSFTLFKDPQEDISEPQFTICGNLIGKSVKLTLQTEAMEKDITNAHTEGKTADIDFEGFITQATSRRMESRQGIQIEALSRDAVLIDHPKCQIFNEETLANIVKEIYNVEKLDTKLVKPENEDSIFYTAQYNETNYDFLRRLARRHSEWFFSTGTALHFGKLGDTETIQLAYPSQDIPDYGVRLQTFHPLFSNIALSYNTMNKAHDYHEDYQEDTGNALSDATYKAAKDIYSHKTSQVTPGTLETDSDIEKENLEAPVFREDQRSELLSRRSSMLIYEGHTYCSKLKIGARLNIKDNYLSNTESNSKSEVNQDEILITEVVHEFRANEEYKNEFKGITATYPHPPYEAGPIHPICHHPVMADVIDTEDPKHWGRVRLRFPWMMKKYKEGHKNGMTPWVHVVQPYKLDKGGVHLIPEIYSQVLVDFEEGNFERPQVIGTRFTPLDSVDEKWYKGDGNLIKAIRTTSGHTVEIHDAADGEKGGFIKIYDNKTHNYALTFSTDRKLIRLQSAGNIELSAKKDIVMTAGNNVSIIAGTQENGESPGPFVDGSQNSLTINVVGDTALKTNTRLVWVESTDTLEADDRAVYITNDDTIDAGGKISQRAGNGFEAGSTASKHSDNFNSAIIIQDSEILLTNNIGNVNIESEAEVNISGQKGIDVSSTANVTVSGFAVQLN